MRRPAATLIVLAAGCAAGPPLHGSDPDFESSRPALRAPPSPDADSRSQAVALARTLLGRRTVRWPGAAWPDDCSGLVLGVYASVGVSLAGEANRGENGVTAIWRYARAHGRVFRDGPPQPGDLVFFHDTYDRNRDGVLNDGLTHVALVESVAPDGTVSVIHRVHKGVVRYHLNLAHPELRVDPRTGRALNDYLRGSGATGRQVLTAQLFAGYGSLLPDPPRGAVRSPLPVLAPQPEGSSI